LIKIFIFLFICSCGREIQLKNKLEDASTLSPTQEVSLQKYGTLIKSDESRITFQGKTYLVSRYSSKSVLEFLKSQPTNVNLNVIFIGGFQGDQAVVESIRLQ
jgi:hypothetical protein